MKIKINHDLELVSILPQREWLYDHFVDHANYVITKSQWEKLK